MPNHDFTPEERSRGHRKSVAARKRYALERRLRAAEALTDGVQVEQLLALMVELATKQKVTAADVRSLHALQDTMAELRAQDTGPAADAADQMRKLLSGE